MKEVFARYDKQCIRVYQAYNAAIAEEAVALQSLSIIYSIYSNVRCSSQGLFLSFVYVCTLLSDITRNNSSTSFFHGAVIEKDADRLIGLCGLNPYQEKEPEIEFKLGVPYWGKGYAAKLGKQMIQDAFAAADIKGIYGMAQPENTASRKVLEKIGMKYLGNQMFRGHEDSFYYISSNCIGNYLDERNYDK